MEEKRFDATWSYQVRLITHGFAIVGLLIFFVNTTDGFSAKGCAASLPLFLLLFAAWGFHPQYYVLRPDGIVVKRPFGDLVIPLSEIEDALPLTKEDLGFSIRLWACGGLFGHFGLYSSKNIGQYYMWSTNTDSMAMIRRKNKKPVIVSPSDRDEFIKLVNALR